MKNYVWEKFWKLFVLKEAERVYTPSRPTWYRMMKCKCDCWNIWIYYSNALWKHTSSCWCSQFEKIIKSNMSGSWIYWSKHPIYNARNHLKNRCNNKNDKGYKNYWWRWITYDPKRETFEWFYEDMKEWWQKWLTIDRINNNWNYCKENCRWTTWKTQQRNKTNNVIYKWKCIAEWAEILSISYKKANFYIKNIDNF